MKLLIYAEGLRGASRFKVLLDFSHDVISPDLDDHARLARWTINFRTKKKFANYSIDRIDRGSGWKPPAIANQGSQNVANVRRFFAELQAFSAVDPSFWPAVAPIFESRYACPVCRTPLSNQNRGTCGDR